MSSTRGRTRREILADAAKTAAAASVAGLAGCFPSVGGRWPDAAVKTGCSDPDGGTASGASAPPLVTPAVVEVHREESVVIQKKAVIQPDVVAAMLDAGLTALANQVALFNAGSSAQDGGAAADDAGPSDPDGGTDTTDAGESGQAAGADNPWKVLLPTYQPGQRIGLKVNCLSSLASTSPAVVRAIIASLRDKLGIDPSMIVVWDRRLDELNGAGKYSADDLAGAKLLGTWLDKTDPDNPDPSKRVTEAMVTPEGLGYGDVPCQAPRGLLEGKPGNWPRLSRILDPDHTNLTINCPVFKVHGQSGITAAMKNIYGMIDIPVQFHRLPNIDPDFLNNNLPLLYALPAIRNSISLSIVDALRAVTTGDTESDVDAYPRRILLAQDPVALDSYALVLMNQLKASRSQPPVDPTRTRWIAQAATLGLGSTDYKLISVT